MPTKKNSTFRIAVLGIGGVGGYVGGKLAAKYHNSGRAEIIFIARGNHAEAMKRSGLSLTVGSEEEIVHPAIISENPDEIGKVDLLIICVKSYDLASSVQKYFSCIESNTVLLPLLNGVNHTQTIRDILPQSRVWDGCIFIGSKVTAPGKIAVVDGIKELYFGSKEESGETLQDVEDLFTEAGMKASHRADIDAVMWKKFAFIAPVSGLTSAKDITIGEIVQNENHMDFLRELIDEVTDLATAKGITMPAGRYEDAIKIMTGFPFEATSSMHRDFKDGRKTELHELAGYVVRLGKEMNVPTPAFDKCFEEINQRWGK